MNRRTILKVITIAACVLICTATAVRAQAQQQVAVKLLTTEELTPVPKSATPLSIRDGDRTVYGQMMFVEGKTRITIPGRPEFELPYVLETLVSRDGKIILQYGDELDQSHPIRTNLYWTDNTGSSLAQVIDYYAENALVSMSDDGFVAVSGPLFEDRTTTVTSLYTPSGEKLWERQLDTGRRPAHLRVTIAGNYVALVTTDATRWLENHQLHIIDKQATPASSISDFRIVQKIVPVDAGTHLFVQGYDDYGLVEISSGLVSWRRSGKIRMASLHGAQMDATGRQLFLTLADFRGKIQPLYRWRLVELDPTNGTERVSVWLPGEHPGTRYRVFEEISPDRVQLRTPSARLTYSWQGLQEVRNE